MSNEKPTMEKSSMKTSLVDLSMSEKMTVIHLWKVEGTSHNPNDILV